MKLKQGEALMRVAADLKKDYQAFIAKPSLTDLVELANFQECCLKKIDAQGPIINTRFKQILANFALALTGLGLLLLAIQFAHSHYKTGSATLFFHSSVQLQAELNKRKEGFNQEFYRSNGLSSS